MATLFRRDIAILHNPNNVEAINLIFGQADYTDRKFRSYLYRTCLQGSAMTKQILLVHGLSHINLKLESFQSVCRTAVAKSS